MENLAKGSMMNNEELISIIVPVYNVEAFLECCINSIVAQTYRKLQIILIDDGSTDGSSQICDAYKEKDSRIEVFHTGNQGVSMARNIGISHAKGEVVVFIDADDWVEENYISRIANEIGMNCDLVFVDYNLAGENIKRCRYFAKDKLFDADEIVNLRISMLYPALYPYYDSVYSIGVPWGKAYKREIIEKNGLLFRDGIKLNEDVLFNLEYLKCCCHIKYISEALYNYRISDISSMKKLEKDSAGSIQVRLALLDIYKGLGEDEKELRSAIAGKRMVILFEALYSSIYCSNQELVKRTKKQLKEFTIINYGFLYKAYIKLYLKYIRLCCIHTLRGLFRT